jgi:hypothetical protein
MHFGVALWKPSGGTPNGAVKNAFGRTNWEFRAPAICRIPGQARNGIVEEDLIRENEVGVDSCQGTVTIEQAFAIARYIKIFFNPDILLSYVSLARNSSTLCNKSGVAVASYEGSELSAK